MASYSPSLLMPSSRIRRTRGTQSPPYALQSHPFPTPLNWHCLPAQQTITNILPSLPGMPASTPLLAWCCAAGNPGTEEASCVTGTWPSSTCTFKDMHLRRQTACIATRPFASGWRRGPCLPRSPRTLPGRTGEGRRLAVIDYNSITHPSAVLRHSSIPTHSLPTLLYHHTLDTGRQGIARCCFLGVSLD